MKSANLVLLAISATTALRGGGFHKTIPSDFGFIPLKHASVPERIVEGSQAEQGEFPHIVQIKHNGSHNCGGSIVNANWIVTAAHCAVESVSGYTLVAGEHNLNQNEGTEQTRSVSQIILHPNYNAKTMANDIAVIKVSQPFSLNNNVRAASIPSSTFSPASSLVAAGWGTLSLGGSSPTVLMKVTVPLVSTTQCRQAYGSKIVSGMLCAGTAGKDSCHGDSGGPLMSGSTLVGVVSWGQGCGASGNPGVYSSVPYFSSWINNQTR